MRRHSQPALGVATLIAMLGAGLLIYQWAGATPLWLDEEMRALNLRDRSLPGLDGPLWLAQSAPAGGSPRSASSCSPPEPANTPCA